MRSKNRDIKVPVAVAFLAAVTLSAIASTAALENEDTRAVSSDLSTPVPEGRIRITSNKTTYFFEKEAYVATGYVQVVIGGQNSILEADKVVYDEKSMTIDARGNVRITRNGNLTTGSAFRFKIIDAEYLITKPGTKVTNPRGIPVLNLFFQRPPQERFFDESLIEPASEAHYPGGYRNGSGSGDHTSGRTGDFGSTELYFTPGEGLTKHRHPSP